MDFSLFLTTFLLLLVVIDPIGNVPVFINALQLVPLRARHRFILRESLIALALLTLFFFFGGNLLAWFQLSPYALGVAGGTVLFLIAIQMVFPTKQNQAAPVTTKNEHAPFIVPVAVPALAGPSALATVMLLSAQTPTKLSTMWSALFAVMFIAALTMLASIKIAQFLGTSGMAACERLMGLLLSAVAVQMILTNLKLFWAA